MVKRSNCHSLGRVTISAGNLFHRITAGEKRSIRKSSQKYEFVEERRAAVTSLLKIWWKLNGNKALHNRI